MAHTDRYAFVVDYDDTQAGLLRKYQLLYYLADDTIEMYDIKSRRMFLKRCPYPALALSDLFVGATVVVYARTLTVADYGDEMTRAVFAKKNEGTLGLINPEGYEKLGQIIKAVQGSGLRIKAMNMVQLMQEEAADFLAEHKSSASFRQMVEQLSQYPVLALFLVGPGSCSKWAGVADSICAQLGPNVVHASRGEEVASREVDFFFGAGSRVARRNNAAFTNCSLCLIKPHAVASGIAGDVISSIMEAGFEVSAMRVANLTAASVEDFLDVYKGVLPEYQAATDHLGTGPCWALEVRAEGAVGAFREFCGPYDPEIARVLRPESLRARYGSDKVKNAVHCTDLDEDGPLESEFFFQQLPQ